MRDINIQVHNDHTVNFENDYVGLNLENLQGTITFNFDDFIPGQARAEIIIDDLDGYILLDQVGETYTLPIKSSLLTGNNILMQLVITQQAIYEKTTDTSVSNKKTYYEKVGDSYIAVEHPSTQDIDNYYEAIIPIWKSEEFYLVVGASINAVETIPEQYPTWIDTINNLINETTQALENIDNALEQVNTAIEETNNLNIDVSKVDTTTTVELTKKDGTTKEVEIEDGEDLQFKWEGTSLGVKTSSQSTYQYVDLQGVQGETGPMGSPFTIAKTYSTEAQMIADYDNMQVGDYVMIDGDIELQENATLWVKEETPAPTTKWHYLADFSGASGIQGETGATPNIQIGTVTSGATPSVTRTGTNENPVLNFVLQKGDTGATGATGPTGNGISNITKTSTSGLVDTYTITYTNGTTQTYEVTNGEDGEVTQEQLDEVIAENDYLNSIIDQIVPKTTATGTSITLDDTLQAKMNMSLSPSELEQDTTTGKNLFDKSTGTSSNGATKTIDGETISITGRNAYSLYLWNLDLTNINQIIISGEIVSGNYAKILISIDGVSKASTETIGQYTRTLDVSSNSTATIYLYANKGSALGSDTTSVYKNIMISVNGGDYEPYTGGIASPNPQYPQEIHTISGDNTIVVNNRNLWNEEWELGGYNTTTGIKDSAIDKIRNKTPIICKPNTQYYVCINNSESSNMIRVLYYDKNMSFISTISSIRNTTITTPANTYYINIMGTTAYGTTYKNDICINISDSLNGTYTKSLSQEAQVNLGGSDLIKTSKTENGYINSSNEIVSSTTWVHTDYIDISNTNCTYTYKSFGSGSNPKTIIYNADKSVKEVVNVSSNLTKILNGTYVRISYANDTTKPQLIEDYVEGNLEYSKMPNTDYSDVFMKPSGSNLFVSEWEQGVINASTGINENNSSIIRTKSFIPVTPNQHYAINRTINNGAINLRCYDINKNYLGTGADYITLISGTTATNPMGTNISQCVIAPKDNVYYLKFNDLSNNLSTLYMMTKGDIQEAYEPYNNNKWYLKKKIPKVVLDEDKHYVKETELTTVVRFYTLISNIVRTSNGFSNRFSLQDVADIDADTEGMLLRPYSTSLIAIKINKSSLSSVDEQGFKTWLSTHNTIVYYQLETPTYTLLNDTLQSQLDTIESMLLSYKGQTSISQVNNDLPFVITSTALKELSN